MANILWYQADQTKNLQHVGYKNPTNQRMNGMCHAFSLFSRKDACKSIFKSLTYNDKDQKYRMSNLVHSFCGQIFVKWIIWLTSRFYTRCQNSVTADITFVTQKSPRPSSFRILIKANVTTYRIILNLNNFHEPFRSSFGCFVKVTKILQSFLCAAYQWPNSNLTSNNHKGVDFGE